MKCRLTHKVKEQILNLTAQAVGQKIKFLSTHKLLLPLCLVTERAGKIAYVRYFKIGFI